jgi:hypothetical protein
LLSNRHFKRLASQGLYRALGYYTFTVGLEKVGIQYMHCFRLNSRRESGELAALITFEMLRDISELTARDKAAIAEHSGEEHLRHYEAAFLRGDRCAIARWNGNELACECWISKQSNYFLAPREDSWLIERCLTVPNYRGRGLYPLTLCFACNELCSRGARPEKIFIECNAFNSASLQGIAKAGFDLAGKRLTFRRWHWHWPRAAKTFSSRCT